MPTWLITGCSTGLGRHLAEAVLARGYNAIVTARDSEGPGPRRGVSGHRARPRAGRDRRHPGHERGAAGRTTVRQRGRARQQRRCRYRAAVEEGEEPEVTNLFATNFFGPVAMIKAVLPGMRARRDGAIVNISSIGARISPPDPATTRLPRPLWRRCRHRCGKELEPLGITVTVVEPGGFRDRRPAVRCSSHAADRRLLRTARRRRRLPDTAHGTQPGIQYGRRRRSSQPSRRQTRRSCCCSARTRLLVSGP